MYVYRERERERESRGEKKKGRKVGSKRIILMLFFFAMQTFAMHARITLYTLINRSKRTNR